MQLLSRILSTKISCSEKTQKMSGFKAAFFLVFAVMALPPLAQAQTNQKIGYIDSIKVFQALPQRIATEKKLEKELKDKAASLKSLEHQIKNKAEKMLNNAKYY